MAKGHESAIFLCSARACILIITRTKKNPRYTRILNFYDLANINRFFKFSLRDENFYTNLSDFTKYNNINFFQRESEKISTSLTQPDVLSFSCGHYKYYLHFIAQFLLRTL